MNINDFNSQNFISYITEATDLLQKYELQASFSMIVKALCINPNSPIPHNILGIIYEYDHNNDLARKHYRASYALDPTYKPASENLERICSYNTFYNSNVNNGKEE